MVENQSFYDNISKVKEALTTEFMFDFLQELGANPTLTGDSNILCDTICHNLPGEGSHKLYYYCNTKLFKCYTGCGVDAFDIMELVVKVFSIQHQEEKSMGWALYYVASKLGLSIGAVDFEESISEDMKIMMRYGEREKKKQVEIAELKEYLPTVLNNLPQVSIYEWYNEGITVTAQKDFNIRFYASHDQIIIPHYDIDNRLIGIRSRNTTEEDIAYKGKYRPSIFNKVQYNHPLGYNLYGLNLAKDNIKIMKKAIVFEGEKSVLKYYSIFGKESNIAVATCGSSFTAYHFKLLKDLGVEEIIIAFDRQFKELNTTDHKTWVRHLRGLVEKYNSLCTMSILFDKDMVTDYKASPIDHGAEVFLELFKNRVIMTGGRKRK